MGAAQTYLDKLDRVQDTAQKIGHFQVEDLQCRREAAVELTSGALISLTVVSLIVYQTIPHSTTRRGVDPCI